MKIYLANEQHNSEKSINANINIILAKREQISEEDRIYVNKKAVKVGKTPKVFYYKYNNREYYFTAKNAKFSISSSGKITWYYGEWIDGFFRNGTWHDGVWYDGTWCNGNWIDGDWIDGDWYKGKIDGVPSKYAP